MEAKRQEVLLQRLQHHLKNAPSDEDNWGHEACPVVLEAKRIVVLDADGSALQTASLKELGSAQLSRYRRFKPNGWFKRLLGLKPAAEDVVQAGLRSSRQRFFVVEAVCTDNTLLEQLSWMNDEGIRVPFSVLARVLLKVLEREGRLALGPLNDPPEALLIAAQLQGRHAKLFERFRAEPSVGAWREMVEALEQQSEETIIALTPALSSLVDAWPQGLRKPSPAWLDALFENDTLNPRLALADISTLDFSKRKVRLKHMSLLANSPALRTLRHINLSGSLRNVNDMTDVPDHELNKTSAARHDYNANRNGSIIKALADSPHPVQLETLDLSENYIGVTGYAALANSPSLHNIKHLNLSTCPISETSMSVLTSATHMGNLERLEMASCRMDADCASALAAWSPPPPLKHLDLSDNKMGDGGMFALAGSSLLSAIRELGLRNNQITELAFEAFFGADAPLRNLRTLDISNNALGKQGAHALAETQRMPRLRRLDLSQCQINVSTLDAFVRQGDAQPRFPKLKHLSLAGNGLVDVRCGKILASWIQLSTVTHLDLRNGFGRSALIELAKSPHIDNLEVFQFDTRLLQYDDVYEALAHSVIDDLMKERFARIHVGI